MKTPLGNSALCLRNNDERASFLGYNVFLTKLSVFSFAGLIAGLVGGLFVIVQEFVATTVIDAHMSFTVMLMTIIGGTQRFFGPVVGVIFYMLFQDWISNLTDNWWLYWALFSSRWFFSWRVASPVSLIWTGFGSGLAGGKVKLWRY